MRSGKIVATLLACICVTSVVQAAIATSERAAVVEVIAYTQFGNGDVTFKLASSGVPACSGGFWIRASDAGSKATIAMIVTAYQTGTLIVVDADTAQIWTGSSSPNCLVWDIRY